MRTAYRKKRDHILNIIKSGPLADISEILEADAGLHFILKLNTKYKDNELTDKLLNRGIKIYPLSYYGNNEEHAFLINYSTVPEDEMEEAIIYEPGVEKEPATLTYIDRKHPVCGPKNEEDK